MNARGPKPSLETSNSPHSEADGPEDLDEASFQAASLGTIAFSHETVGAQQRGVAEYIESICVELRMLARAAKLETLVYFLDMARIEATIQIESHGTLGKTAD